MAGEEEDEGRDVEDREGGYRYVVGEVPGSLSVLRPGVVRGCFAN